VNRQYTGKIIVVDGVYSMDGDIANLPEISDLAKKYNALVMVDEAHAFGVIGSKGLGILDYYDMPHSSIDILTGTLSKAIGSQGGFVAGNEEMINYLTLASRPYFFTTAPFVAANAAAHKSIQIIKEDINRRNKLWDNIRYFRQKLKEGNFNTGNAQTAIFPVILGDHNKVLKVTNRMGMNGVLANGIPYPAVSRKQTRIRMSLTAELTKGQLDKGYNVLVKSIKEYDRGKDMETTDMPTYMGMGRKKKIHETA
jgi:glycine C-acetyltransferase